MTGAENVGADDERSREDETGATVLTVAPATPNTRALAQMICDRWSAAVIAARHVDRLQHEVHAAPAIIQQLTKEKRDRDAALDAAIMQAVQAAMGDHSPGSAKADYERAHASDAAHSERLHTGNWLSDREG